MGIFVALGIQRVMCMHHIVICCMPNTTISHKWHDFF